MTGKRRDDDRRRETGEYNINVIKYFNELINNY